MLQSHKQELPHDSSAPTAHPHQWHSHSPHNHSCPVCGTTQHASGSTTCPVCGAAFGSITCPVCGAQHTPASRPSLSPLMASLLGPAVVLSTSGLGPLLPLQLTQHSPGLVLVPPQAHPSHSTWETSRASATALSRLHFILHHLFRPGVPVVHPCARRITGEVLHICALDHR